MANIKFGKSTKQGYTVKGRREYPIDVRFNGLEIKKVIIYPHYEKKHSGSVNDELILDLLRSLDGEDIEADVNRGKFTYIKIEKIALFKKEYRLVLLIEKGMNYIGVVNCFRRG